MNVLSHGMMFLYIIHAYTHETERCHYLMTLRSKNIGKIRLEANQMTLKKLVTLGNQFPFFYSAFLLCSVFQNT